jgi:Zn finger protein HypA/HybF involved in hydrogenase expression
MAIGGKGTGFYPPKPGRSLAELHPELLIEWDEPELNPANFGTGSGYKIRWKCCTCEHKWVTKISARTTAGKNCPACVNQAIHIDGRNSLASMFPNIASEWYFEDFTPAEVTHSSNKRVSWKCNECSHKWNTSIANRTVRKSNCPACVGQAVHSDKRNSLATLRPDLIKDWNESNLTPDDVTGGSEKRISWKCHVCEHEWKCNINNRTKSGCPFCTSNRLHSDGRNALTITHPRIIKDWNESLLNPKDITAGYDKKTQWRCNECEYEWKTSVYERTHGETGCPVCKGRIVHPDGRNSLGTLFPEFVEEWNEEQDSVFNIRPGSNKSFKWKCKVCEYKWKTSPNNRTKKDGTGCPKCAKTGFDPSEPAVYYCMEIYGPDGLWWYKGGITADINRRRDSIESSLNSNDLPLHVKVVSMLNFDCGSDARELETKLLRAKDIRVKTVEKFDGSFELFSVNPVDYAIGEGFLEGKKTTQSSLENFIP